MTETNTVLKPELNHNECCIISEEDFLKTYQLCISKTKLGLLRLRKWLPLVGESILAEKSAYLVGKVMGD